MKTKPPAEYSTFKVPGTTGKQIRSLSERKSDFYSYINVNGTIPEHCPSIGRCHVWTKSCLKSGGYGQFNINGIMWRAHVLAFLWSGGQIEDGQCVCHRCDNPRCCNPDHLFAGTRNANMQDMIVKGRAVHPNGENAGMTKLTKEQAQMILAIWNTSKVTKAKIARYFGLERSHIGNIVSGFSWKGIEPSKDTATANRIADELNAIYSRKHNSTEYKTGELHPNSRLTDAAIAYIKEHHHGNIKSLSILFGITEGYVREIASGRRRSK